METPWGSKYQPSLVQLNQVQLSTFCDESDIRYTPMHRLDLESIILG